mgnify:CR=1 FL=1
MAFNMDSINTTLNSGLDSMGADIAAKTSSSSGEMSEVELLQLQQSLQKWSIMVNMHTNIQKTWSDALKSIVQNLR